ncbi:MAG: succinate dehydrogenase, cytochrome b556 subunit [Nitrospirae bacterium]|nr:succinate dehydrogenase, cytochrome b556 subunit [Nitrospirota bacterium]
MRYKVKTGTLAWIIHRGTGVALTLYLFLHLWVLVHLKDAHSYRELIELMRSPVVRLSEAGLLALVIAHGLNGIRVMIVDLGLATKEHKGMFWSLAGIGLILFIFGAWPILKI